MPTVCAPDSWQRRGAPARFRDAILPRWKPLLVAAALLAGLGGYPVQSNGLRATHFDRPDWKGVEYTRVERTPAISGPALPFATLNGVSVQWIGSLVVERTGRYQLRLTATAPCEVALGDKLSVDARVPGIPEIDVPRGVYTITVRCSTPRERLNVSVWWDVAGTETPSALSSDVLFPRRLSFEEYRRLIRIRAVQRLLAACALAIVAALVLAWAGTGPIAAAIVILTGAAIAAIGFDWPSWLRGPPEWFWGHRAAALDHRLFAALACGTVMLALIAIAGTSRAARRPRLAAVVLLVAGLPIGFAFHAALLNTDDGGWERPLIDRVCSGMGYLKAAEAHAQRPTLELLRHYTAIVATLPFHATTHPPGGVLMFRALFAAARRGWIRDAGGEPIVDVTRTGGGIAMWGAVIWIACGILTAVPVALMAWVLTRQPLLASSVGLLWLFCPSPIAFDGVIDEAVTLCVACSAALLLLAQVTSSRVRGCSCAAASGIFGGAGLFVSYGAAAMLVAAVLIAMFRIDTDAGRRRFVATTCCWLAAVGGTVLLPAAAGYPVVATARLALKTYHDLQVTRDYSTWVVASVVDFASFWGPAAIVAAIATLATAPRDGAAWRVTIAIVAVLLLVNVSGTSRGEVGRLWMPFMPLLSAAVWSSPVWSPPGAAGRHLQPRDAAFAGGSMMFYAIALQQYWVTA
jgi:hypothetical protein